MILQHRFPFQQSNRTCATALSVCLHVSDPISAVTVPPPSTPTPPLVHLVCCFNNNPPRCRKGLVCQLFSNSLPHCKNQGIRQPSWSPDKARAECYMWQKRKAHHSQQSAQHSHPSSQTKQQQSAAKQASKHPLSLCCLTTTGCGGPWLDLLDCGPSLTKEGCLGWVPDLLVLHSVGKRLVSFLGRTGAFTKTYGGPS